MSNTKENRTLTIERILKAPIKLVWEAWTQGEHIVQWWGPPGMETKIVEHNFCVGGQWKYIMKMPNGSDFIADGMYSEIVELQRIISSANFRPMTEGVEIQVHLEESGDQTKFTFKVVHPTEAYCKQQADMGAMNGWGSVFDRLEIFLDEAKN